jgi:hypothetical protein
VHLNQDRLEQVAGRIAAEDIDGRQIERTRAHNRTVYGITPTNARERLQMLFNIVIQARATPLSASDYRTVADAFDPDRFLTFDAHADAFAYLTAIDDVGQKIANEFLRQTVDVMKIRPEWTEDLHVPLDIHVVKGFLKTGCIGGGADPQTAEVRDIVNVNIDANPHTLIGYTDLQDALADAAATHGLPRIAFDELWVEHRHFLSDVFLADESFLADLRV